jgi:hypothetical protein
VNTKSIATPIQALHRTDLATPEHAALGIQAFALHSPNTFDPAGSRIVQAWVQSPTMSSPQYVGSVLDTDSAAAIELLERTVQRQADDIVEELTPPPAPPAPARAILPLYRHAHLRRAA